MFIWVILTVGLAVYSSSGLHWVKPFKRGYADTFYGYAAIAFSIGTLFAWLGVRGAKTSEKKTMAKVFMYVNLIATSTYIIQATRLTPVLRGVNGMPVDLARFLEWFSTCPPLIHMIGAITRNPKLSKKIISSDYMVKICGFMASISREPYSYIFSTVAVAAFCHLILGLWSMFTNAIDGETDCKLDVDALKFARTLTIYSWIAFPITWHLQKS
jgi:bacteriorhodopsin